MGANYVKAGSSNDSDTEVRKDSISSSGGGPGGSKGLRTLTHRSEDITTESTSSVGGKGGAGLEMHFKKRSRSLDAGSNRSPASFASTASRGSRVDRLRRRSRKKSMDCVEDRIRRGVDSLEEASKEEEEAEEEVIPEQLTDKQKQLVKETWKILQENVSRVGVVMFMGLFETHPDVQEVFLPFRGLSSDELKLNKQLKSHGLRVMNLVEKAVVRLDKPEVLIPLLETCGKNHCGYGAKAEHVDLVGPQLINAIRPTLSDHWNPEIEEAWVTFMANLSYVMKKAMREQASAG